MPEMIMLTVSGFHIKQQIMKEMSKGIVFIFKIIYMIPYIVIQKLIKC